MCCAKINENQLHRLESVQGMMIKMIFQLKEKFSFNSLDVEFNILPIELCLQQILCNLRQDNSNYFKTCLSKRHEQI